MDAITCPACGATVTASVEGSSGVWDIKVVIECDEMSCGAIWDASGNVVRTRERFRAEVDALAARYSIG